MYTYLNNVRYSIEGWLFSHSKEAQKIRTLRGNWSGRPALIVGNGPSLNQTPMDRFIGVHSIGMNKIDMLFGNCEWRPSLITCVNRHVVSQHRKHLLSTRIPLVLAWQTRYSLRFGRKNNIYYFFNNRKVFFSRDFAHEAGSGATVTFTALQLAHYLGADPVVLVGVDHNFDIQGKPHELQKRIGKDVNHFHPEYFAEGVKWNLPDLETSEIAYIAAKQAFEKDGRIILDATIGGNLSVFAKVSIEQAIKILGAEE